LVFALIADCWPKYIQKLKNENPPPIDHIGRVPDLIYELDRINPGVPVFINSPLGIQITRLYQEMGQCWDREAKTLKAAGFEASSVGWA
jgi:hypothetical protein